MSGVTLDAGPMIQLDRDERRVVALLALADETGIPVVIPGAALAQAIRQPARQPRLARLLRQPRTEAVALDRADATDVGRLLAASGTTDIADAHVVLWRTAVRSDHRHERSGRPARARSNRHTHHHLSGFARLYPAAMKCHEASKTRTVAGVVGRLKSELGA